LPLIRGKPNFGCSSKRGGAVDLDDRPRRRVLRFSFG
jgi:hypothetical protein